MSKNRPRRPAAGSRNPTSRPRRLAGIGSLQPDKVTPDDAATEIEPGEVEPGEVESGEVESGEVESGEVESGEVESGEVESGEVESDEVEVEPSGVKGRTVPVLALVIAVLLALGSWELISILDHEDPQDRAIGPVTVERPVQVDELTARSVVDQAAQAAVAIGSASWEDYEAGVDAAAAMMTDSFAETYRETKADVKEQVVDQRVDVTVQIDAQGVVRADPSEIVALVFLTQSTIAGTGPVTPRQYRATVTMTKTGDGWLVSDLDAGDLLDITGADG